MGYLKQSGIPPQEFPRKEQLMQRMALLIVLAALAALFGCAPRDPNLAVRGLGEFGRAPGDYTLHVNLYDLDENGKPRLAVADDPSLKGFASRTLAARGYTLRADGPARYNLEVHLLCGNMRKADTSLMTEELLLPAGVVGPSFDRQVHYWLPDKSMNSGVREADDLRESVELHRNMRSTEYASPAKTQRGGAPLGKNTPDFCQGRVLVVLTPAANGPKREVFVGRAASEDSKAVASCPVDVCRSALEQGLVELLENRF
jgi:hypothetical protein